MSKHWIVVSLSSAGNSTHAEVVTTDSDTRPSGRELRDRIEETRGPVANLWSLGPMESREAAEYSVEQLRDMTNLIAVMAEQAATFR